MKGLDVTTWDIVDMKGWDITMQGIIDACGHKPQNIIIRVRMTYTGGSLATRRP